MSGLGQLQREALAEEQEAVEEAACQLDVVIDDQQPVVTVGRVPGEQPVEVLELAPSFGRGAVQLDVMSRAQQLVGDGPEELAALGALDA